MTVIFLEDMEGLTAAHAQDRFTTTLITFPPTRIITFLKSPTNTNTNTNTKHQTPTPTPNTKHQPNTNQTPHYLETNRRSSPASLVGRERRAF